MAEVDNDWVRSQLTENKTKKVVGDSVLKLLATWEQLKQPTDKNAKDIINIFSKLALGHSIVEDNPNEKWIVAQAGYIKVADTVRVRSNAFDGEQGKAYNGRRGRVVGVRYGDVIVKTDDGKTPVLDGIHFKPENLEKLV
jgi:ribosomal protein L21E